MFYQIQDYKGVDTEAPTPSIMVPRGGYNLVIHDFGRTTPLNPDPGIDVKDLTDSLKIGIGAALQTLTQFVGAPLGQQPTYLLTKAKGNLNGSKRLIAITSKLTGDYQLNVAGNSQALTVAVRKYKTVGLCFVYYQYTGDDHQAEWSAFGWPSDTDAHAKTAIHGLNYYFRPQANIEFTFQGASDWERKDYHPTWYGRDGQFYDQDLAKLAHSGGGDITVIVVPEIGDTDKNAFTDGPDHYPGLKGEVSWVPLRYQATKQKHLADPKADFFVAELGHELVHAFGKVNHSHRAFVMCNEHDHGSKLDQEYLIDKVTLDFINPIK